jgi:photosystem II stability/assembly factor-like uncharacterized protein
MKFRHLPSVIFIFTITALLLSFILLSNKENDREKYEQYLLETGKKVDSRNQNPGTRKEEAGKSFDEPHMAAFQDYLQTMDPKEKRVPTERLIEAYNQVKSAQAGQALKMGNPLQWEIIPSNMGGRTRCSMWDPNSATGNKVWAGAVTGGLWYNNNILSPLSLWMPVNDLWPSLSISNICYDPNDPQTFYVGTGEAFTARVIYRESSGLGAGIFKSNDGGETWEQLQSTLNFKFVTDVEVRNENGNSVVYAGVVSGIYHGTHQSTPNDGLYRSTDGGNTWFQVMPLIPGTNKPYPVSDIEITTANRIVVGTMANLDGDGGATILYSDQGLSGSWTVYDDYVDIIQGQSEYNIPNRVMLAAAPSNPDIIYALFDAGKINTTNGFIYTQGRHIARTDNGGQTWNYRPIPQTGGNFWATIGWHALTVGVDPNNPESLYIGGLDVFKSSNGGQNWNQVSDWSLMYYGGGDEYVHADIHDIDYKPGSSDEMLVTSDGGVFYTNEAGSSGPAFQEKNQGYGSLQFYTCGLIPSAGNVRCVGGLQDNGTLYYTGAALTINHMIDGGDGSGCFIDQTQGQYMITSVYYNQYTLWNNGNWYAGMSDWSSGTFVSPADYDDDDNILYANACAFGGQQANQILRISGIPNNINGNFINLNTGLSTYYTAVECSPNSPAGTTTLFIGSLTGRLFRVLNAQATPQVAEITGDDFPEGAISAVAIGGSDDTLLVVLSNYGVSSVWQTYDGGQSWAEKEANLPDMPIRWALYHPNSTKHAMLATELGIWTTSNLDEDETVWVQDIAGLANVRVDMLQIRLSDFTVLAATHGRGLATAVWDITTGVEEPGSMLAGDVEVWPNPTTGKFQITSTKFQTNSKNQIQNSKLELVDIYGNVLEIPDCELRTANCEPDISHLPAGIYFIRIHLEDQTIVKKIIKL